MTIEFADVLKLHDEAFLSSQDTREKAADDLLFARVTQWDSPYLETQLEYRGQFDQIRKARRQNLSEMRANPVQVSYIAGRDANEDTADILERKYRFDMSTPAAKQTALIAQQDQLDCGLGAWRVVTDTENSVTNEQFIKREPIHEANNRLFIDPNFVMPDGSDAGHMSIVWTISDLGWEKFAKHIGVSPEPPATFRPPEDSNAFPWSHEDKVYNISEFYYREKVERQAYLFENDEGEQKLIKDEDFDDILDELMDTGYTFVEEREYDTYEVTKYWVSGGGFLENEKTGHEGEVIAGTEIPIVISWGEVSKVENQWTWEGLVRLAKDPQRLRNMMLSYLADIAAKGARQRPYFRMSQISGLEWQFEEGGPDDNRPYRVLNDTDEDGNTLEGGPVAYEQSPDLPPAMGALLEATTGAIDDVTSPGIPQDVASSELSGKAVTAMHNRVDMQTFTYLDNFALALQREAEIYASMCPQIYDTQRDIGLLAEDGTEEEQEINSYLFDTESGRMIKLYDFTKGEYRVRTKVTPAYSSRRDQTRAQRIELFAAAEGNPEAQDVLLMEIMMMSDGDSDVTKTFARHKLLDHGLLEPESDDDKEYMQQQQEAQAEQPPDPMMVAAQAEDKKAQADLMEAQNKQMGVQVDQMNAKTNEFKALTERYKAMVEAEQAGVNVELTVAKKQGQLIDNAAAMQEMQTREITLDLSTGQLG
jgi:hypothetical protein